MDCQETLKMLKLVANRNEATRRWNNIMGFLPPAKDYYEILSIDALSVAYGVQDG